MMSSFIMLISLSKKELAKCIVKQSQRGIFSAPSKSSAIAQHQRNRLLMSSRKFSDDSTISSKLLPYKEKPYDGILISVNDYMVEETAEFATRLYETINHVKDQGKTSIMIDFPIVHSHLIPVAG